MIDFFIIPQKSKISTFSKILKNRSDSENSLKILKISQNFRNLFKNRWRQALNLTQISHTCVLLHIPSPTIHSQPPIADIRSLVKADLLRRFGHKGLPLRLIIPHLFDADQFSRIYSFRRDGCERERALVLPSGYNSREKGPSFSSFYAAIEKREERVA